MTDAESADGRAATDIERTAQGANLGKQLTRGRLLARNTVWNFLGSGGAIVAAVVTVPLLVTGMGTARYGVLLLVWMLVGYAGLFDLGTGRALTKLTADRIGAGRIDEIPGLFWMTMLLMAALGVIVALIIAMLTPWLVQLLRVPPELLQETQNAFYVVALCLPVVISTTGLSGMLEAWQRFDLIALVNVPMGILQYVGPLVVLYFTNNLAVMVASILIVRMAAWCVRLWMVFHVMPSLRHGYAWRPDYFGPLLSFGGWLTITAITSPLMVTLDRFQVGALTSLDDVAYYATPIDILNRLLTIPVALTGVLFPAFAVTYTHDNPRAAGLYGRTGRYIYLIMFPLVLVAVAFATQGLTLWLGPTFAANSAVVLQLIAIGVLFNSVGRLAFTFVIGVGKAKWSGLLHLAELPIFVGLLYLLTTQYGIKGAAVAGMLRYMVDTVILMLMVRRLLPAVTPDIRALILLLSGGALLLFSFMLPLPPVYRVIWFGAVLTGFVGFAWLRVLSAQERTQLTGVVARASALRPRHNAPGS
ncbi:MAG: flippase [Anaerolineales bacterium]|nr:flippase [Anaerolineales bacterium]